MAPQRRTGTPHTYRFAGKSGTGGKSRISHKKAAAKPSPQPLSCASQRASRPEPGADVPTIRPCRSSDLCLRRQDPLPSQVAPMTGLRQRGRCLDTYSAGRAGIRTPLSCYSPQPQSAPGGHRNYWIVQFILSELRANVKAQRKILCISVPVLWLAAA